MLRRKKISINEYKDFWIIRRRRYYLTDAMNMRETIEYSTKENFMLKKENLPKFNCRMDRIMTDNTSNLSI
jgi:hypothetical protein